MSCNLVYRIFLVNLNQTKSTNLKVKNKNNEEPKMLNQDVFLKHLNL